MSVAACLAFRNAAPYLNEWLLFHLAAGVDHFFLYDNDSEDDYRAVVQPYVEEGQVTLLHWPGLQQQNAIYDDCLRRTRRVFSWVAFIDDDEFLFHEAGLALSAALEPYAAFAGVAVCWNLFGSSRQIYRDTDWVVRRFSWRRGALDPHHKCIVRPDCVLAAVQGGHCFLPVWPMAVVDQARVAQYGALSNRPAGGSLRLHHYLTKSIEEMVERRLARDIGTGLQPKLPLGEWFKNDREWNEVNDPSARVLLTQMEQLQERFQLHRS